MRKIEKYINERIKELKEVDEGIEDKHKKLVDDKTNQHMRITASLSILNQLKKQLSDTKENAK